MSAEDLQLTTEGLPVAATEGHSRGCSEWLKFVPNSFELKPGASQTIKCEMKIPRNATGGYYGLIQCDLKAMQPTTQREAGIRLELRHRLVSVLLLTVRGPGRLYVHLSAEKLDWTLGGTEADKDQPGQVKAGWTASAEVHNSGTVHGIVSGSLRIYGEGKRSLAQAKFQAGKGYVFPDSTRVFRAHSSQRLPDGIYLLNASFRLEGSRYRMAGLSKVFSVVHGVVKSGEPTAAMREIIAQSRPDFLLQVSGLEFDIPPRGRRTKSVQVLNLTDEQLVLHPRILAWDIAADGTIFFPEVPEHERFLSEHLSVQPSPVVLRPHAQTGLRLVHSLPQDAEGEYYAALTFVREGESLPEEDEILADRSVLVVAQATGSLRPSAIIPELNVKELEGGGYQFEIMVENTGNCRCAADGQIEIVHGGETIERLSFGSAETFLLPAGQRKFTINWPRVLEPGGYRAIATVRYAEGEQAKKDFAFSVEEGTAVSPGEMTEESTAQ